MKTNAPDIKWTDIFDVVEFNNRRGKTVCRLCFKSDGRPVTNDYVAKDAEHAEAYAKRWIKKNPEKAADILFEVEVLNVKTEV